MPWRTIDGDRIAPKGTAELEITLKGVFPPPECILDLLRHFIVFEVDGDKIGDYSTRYTAISSIAWASIVANRSCCPNGSIRIAPLI